MAAASGPDPADWLAGLLRSLHPLRWLLCLVGLMLTGVSAILALSFFGGGPPDLPGWLQQPIEHAQALRAEIVDGSLARMILRGGALLALNTGLWCLIGGWVARDELVARRRSRSDIPEERVEPGPTTLLVGRWKSLLGCCACVVVLGLLCMLPALVGGWVCAWLGGFGALVVSLLLPVVLVADLVLLLIGLGALAWPLMPVAVAAECGDQFDAVSRCYSYSFQRPVRFVLLTVIALGVAGLPLAVLYSISDQTAAWQPEARQIVLLLAAALSASIFWSLQTMVYLHLRAAIDDVDANEVAVEPRPAESPKGPSPDGKTAEVSASGETSPTGWGRLVRMTILLLGGVAGSWWLTFWLLTRASGARPEWLGWGLGETFVPPAEGIYRVASVIAGLWGFAWVALPVVQALRQLRAKHRQ